MAVDDRRRTAGPITAVEWASTPIQNPFHAVWRRCHSPKVDTSPAIHRYHTYGIMQGSLLHAYATPTIFNWVSTCDQLTSVA